MVSELVELLQTVRLSSLKRHSAEAILLQITIDITFESDKAAEPRNICSIENHIFF